MELGVGGSNPPCCTKTMVKEKKLKPELASGFTDRKGNELILKDRLIEIIKRNFQLYGFEPLETPGFEISENIGKFLPDEGRPMSGVFGFKDEKDWISLRYDLTAPLARYVAKNFDKLSKPFKRYQVGSVWRNEKPGPGRFREFTQIDADIVGTKNILADAEMCFLLADTLEQCGLEKNEYKIKVSNRKLFFGILEYLKISDGKKKLGVLRAIDKYDRLGPKGVEALLGKGRKDESGDFTKGVGLNKKEIEFITEFLDIADQEFFRNPSFANYEGISSTFKKAEEEIKNFFALTRSSKFRDKIVFSPSLVRGIEYYTGTIFEANLLFKVKNNKGDEVEFGSVAGGGRYDDLVSRFTNNSSPATGISIGLDRLLVGIQQRESFVSGVSTKLIEREDSIGPVVICTFEKQPFLATAKEETQGKEISSPYYNLLSMLRLAGINSEIYCGDGNLKAQIKYADKRNSPAVILYGEDEIKSGTITIKNLRLGKKVSAQAITREDWTSNKKAQITVREEDLVNEIKKLL